MVQKNQHLLRNLQTFLMPFQYLYLISEIKIKKYGFFISFCVEKVFFAKNTKNIKKKFFL